MMNSGDTAWVLISAALVLFMIPGLALFYGGPVAEKNVINMMAQSFAAIGVIGTLWAVAGYSFAFGDDHWGVIGGFSHVLLRGVGTSPSSFAPHIPALLFMAYQMMFAIITPALIAGAFTNRMHFRGCLVFIGLWSVVVYCPFAHWVWGGGFLGPDGLGAVDFAGGAVVHELAGASALATVLFLGRRRCTDRPHNVPMVLLGRASCGLAGSASTPAAPRPQARSRPPRSLTPSWPAASP
jgi:Amt family ammonium transporter